jgi:hypothetical protein
MTKRMTAALGATLLFAAVSLAQTQPQPAQAQPVQAQLAPPQPAPSQPALPQSALPQSTLPQSALPQSPTGANPNFWQPSPAFDPMSAPAASFRPARPADQGFWASADFLVSWLRPVTLPPLVATSPVGTPQAAAGVLGGPTNVLFGGTAEGQVRAGFRLGLGYWFGATQTYGIEAGAMFISSQSTSFAGSSDSFPILAQPFVDVRTFTPTAFLVAFPGLSTGSVSVQASSGSFYEGHIDLAAKLIDDGGPLRMTALIGYRYVRYNESLTNQSTLTPAGAVFPAGTSFVTNDNFSTSNQFNGLDVGLRPQFVWQALSLDFLARVAVGNMQHNVDVSGSQVVTVPGLPTVVHSAGLFAQASNSGAHVSNDCVVLPEVGAGIGWRILPNLKLRAGYSVLFLNGVARAPDQVSTNLNPSRFAGSLLPATGSNQPFSSLTRTDVWIQSLNLGLEFTY